MRGLGEIEGYSIRPVAVNGHRGAVGPEGNQRVVHVMGLDSADGQIQGIRSIANPDKLRHLDPTAMPAEPRTLGTSPDRHQPQLSRGAELSRRMNTRKP